MLSSKAKYALRALVALAEAAAEDRPILIATIAERQALPRKFLELILLDLKRAGLIDSRRGRLGGYVLTKPAAEIRLADVLRLIDGPLALVPCVSRTAFRPCADCPGEPACTLQGVMAEARDAVAAVFEHRTLADILPPPRDPQAARMDLTEAPPPAAKPAA